MDTLSKLACDSLFSLFSLVASCKSEMHDGKFRVQHIYREGNYVADKLAEIDPSLEYGCHSSGRTIRGC